jgi:hypothetical protein
LLTDHSQKYSHDSKEAEIPDAVDADVVAELKEELVEDEEVSVISNELKTADGVNSQEEMGLHTGAAAYL